MLKLEKLVRIINAISAWSGEIAQYLLLPLALIVFIEVVKRYFFNAPSIWAYELSEYLFGIFSMLGGAYCMRYNVHVNVTLVYDRFSPGKKAWMNIFNSLFIFFFCGVLLWKGWAFAYPVIVNLETSGSVWDPPYWPYVVFLPISAGLMVLQGLAEFITYVITIIQKKEAI